MSCDHSLQLKILEMKFYKVNSNFYRSIKLKSGIYENLRHLCKASYSEAKVFGRNITTLP